MKILINGRLTGEKDAKISVFDRGFLYGDAIFETMRSYDGKVFMLDRHVERLFAGLNAIKIPPPYSKSAIKRSIYSLMRANRFRNAYIRLTVTRGEGTFGVTHKDDLKSNTVIVTKPFTGYPAHVYERGLSARIVKSYVNERSPLSRVKSGNFLPYILARFEAKSRGGDEAILLNARGDVAEAATSNIFIVKGRTVITPSIDSGILPGVTRGVVIELAKRLGFKVAERRVACRELYSAYEIFLTNSLSELIPVTSVDRKRIGSGLPGSATKLIHICYRILTR